ncbi:gamma-glutamyl-gamma-aminobutyrate hydrolase family protein [Brucella intermedia]|uniref:gamma-glutamyl-gamma-aminobutyrate hydrolase family protein n=1 Tax=Brucella intermedia TaxID=94625 RepID=UPI0023628434|nr:gamma-glutamyl-gamma-aminobutyrate hydrolase family protein [Brucella intermedia]
MRGFNPDNNMMVLKLNNQRKSGNPKPPIAVIMGENTSAGGDRYDISKHYFAAIHRAGGVPYGIPYLSDIVDRVTQEFDGFLSIGARIKFPDAWYVEGDRSAFPFSDRLEVEVALMKGFLARDKPVLGICNGMQMLGCLNGCRMVSDVHASLPNAINHDQADLLHEVAVSAGTKMAGILQVDKFNVNTFHREALVDISKEVTVTARGSDGVIEAIEIPSQSFAMGVQWHPELFGTAEHPGSRLFGAFVNAAAQHS